MSAERAIPERAHFRTLVAEFKANFPFEGEYLVQARANEIGARIDFENDSTEPDINSEPFLRASIRGASKAQIRNWPEDVRRKARGVEAMLEVLYPLGGD